MQGHPVHLWDALSGQLRATYAAHNAADEVHAATSLAFSQVPAFLLDHAVKPGHLRHAWRCRTAGPHGKFAYKIYTKSARDG